MQLIDQPLQILTQRLYEAVCAAAGAELPEFDAMLRRSNYADYQSNVAMAMAKRLGRPPRELAAQIIQVLAVDDVCQRVDLSGPGFINLTLRDDYIARCVTSLYRDPTSGILQANHPQTIVVDYSAPNAAKEMHVGHLRSTIIGDTLVRVLEAVGHRVLRQNHVGDWGTPFGMLIEHLIELGATDEPLMARDTGSFYREARAKFDRDPVFAERARQRVVLLQRGDADTLEMWQRLIRASMTEYEAIYRRLGVILTAEDYRPESAFNADLPDVIRELTELGLAVESDGAICIFVPGFRSEDDKPLPLIIRKQDGGYTYGTTDLAALRFRTKNLRAERILYVVGAPQAQHLAMVFAAGKMAGWLHDGISAQHVAFGSVLGPDRKMLKSRAGGVIRLTELLDEAERRARAVIAAKSPDFDPNMASEVARSVGIGALKYADLCNDRAKDYVFDWDKMLAFEGNTAPYLMYAHARIRSLLRKANAPMRADPTLFLGHPAERALGLALLRFGTTVLEVENALDPHRLCVYLFDLAVTFSTFYELCPVLRADSHSIRDARLALSDLTARVIAAGLRLLGIDAPEQM
jgi:arginyl-tRNA synthetase